MFRCLIINPPLANHSHGTGKQVQYFVESSGFDCHHLCWSPGSPLGDEPCAFTNLYYDKRRGWPIETGRGFTDRLQRKLGLIWESDGKLSRGSARKVKDLRRGGFDAAYVIVSSEEQAAAANACLRQLEIPYIVNWMDMEVRGGTELSADSHPQIAELCTGAAEVFALTGSLKRAIGRCVERPIKIIRVGRPGVADFAAAPRSEEPLRCVMIGSTAYDSVSNLWPKVLEMAMAAGLDLEFFYMGSEMMRKRIPGEVRVNYLGSISDAAERDRQLAGMHVGLLPGPDKPASIDYLARYSFPSRIADYLMHGLPVVGSIDRDSATAEELECLSGKAVWLSSTPEPLAEVLARLAREPQLWKQASLEGKAYGNRNFSFDIIVETLVNSLKAAAGLGVRSGA